jgi:hypothetical protein
MPPENQCPEKNRNAAPENNNARESLSFFWFQLSWQSMMSTPSPQADRQQICVDRPKKMARSPRRGAQRGYTTSRTSPVECCGVSKQLSILFFQRALIAQNITNDVYIILNISAGAGLATASNGIARR